MEVANGCNVFPKGTWTSVLFKKRELIFILEKKQDVCLYKVLFYVNLIL